jgi:hypothetical protein
MLHSKRVTGLTAVLFLFIGVQAYGQVAYLAKGNQEVNVFGGLSYGLDSWRGSFGGNYAYAFNKYVMTYGEYSYFPGISRSIGETRNSAGNVISTGGVVSIPFQDVHGGVHLRLPVFPEKRIVPYLAGGLGWLGAKESGSLQVRQGNVFVPFPYEFESRGFAVNGGGGMRFYLSGNGRFGIRLEAKVYKPTSGDNTSPFGKISLGIFYQFQ